MSESIGWYKDQWMNIDNIFIPASDRGLKFGDGVFETILIKQNKPILIKEHLNRLEQSARLLNISYKINKSNILEIIKKGIIKLSLKNNQLGSVRINYSRGINQGRSIKINKNFQTNSLSNLWIEFYQIEPNLSPISVYISRTERRNELSLISKCKTFAYNQAIQVLVEANQKFFDDCLLLNTIGELCCGSTFNLLIKRNDEWITPRKESGCLEGVMVNKALDLGIVKEQLILPNFKEDDVILAINSLSCRQINKVNDMKFKSDFDQTYFWELLYN